MREIKNVNASRAVNPKYSVEAEGCGDGAQVPVGGAGARLLFLRMGEGGMDG
jgi:hypothetical protein